MSSGAQVAARDDRRVADRVLLRRGGERRGAAFVKRGGGTIVAVDANDLGAAEGDGDRARIRIERAQDVELPISIDVVHLDEARDYQSSTVRAAGSLAPRAA